MKTISPQEIQNKIYREMPDKKKMELTIQLFRMGKMLNTFKNDQPISRTRKFKANRRSS